MSEKARAVAMIVTNGDGRYLLQMRDSQGTSPLLWCLFAGSMEAGESYFDAAVREFHEETGLRFGPVRFALVGTIENATHVIHVLRLDAAVGWPFALYEGAGCGFFTRDEVEGLRLRGCLTRWMWTVLERGWI